MFQKAFYSFMANDFQQAVDKSTKASWEGSGYSLELFEDGTYRVLCDTIDNLYESTGVIIPIPALGEDEWSEELPCRRYDKAEDTIRDSFYYL